MLHHLISSLACLLLVLLLSACESYDFKVNDKGGLPPPPPVQGF